jgi:hypothetical protein
VAGDGFQEEWRAGWPLYESISLKLRDRFSDGLNRLAEDRRQGLDRAGANSPSRREQIQNVLSQRSGRHDCPLVRFGAGPASDSLGRSAGVSAVDDTASFRTARLSLAGRGPKTRVSGPRSAAPWP